MTRYTVVDKRSKHNVYDSVPYNIKRNLDFYNMTSKYAKCSVTIVRVLSCIPLILCVVILITNGKEFRVSNDGMVSERNCEIEDVYTNDISVTLTLNGTIEVTLSLYTVADRVYAFSSNNYIEMRSQQLIKKDIVMYTYKQYFEGQKSTECYFDTVQFNFNGITEETTFTVWRVRLIEILIYNNVVVIPIIFGLLIMLYITGIENVNSKFRSMCVTTSYGVACNYNGIITYLFELHVDTPVTANDFVVNVITELTVDVNSDDACIICYTNESTVVIEPCKHKCVCVYCYYNMTKVYKVCNCPICRVQMNEQ